MKYEIDRSAKSFRRSVRLIIKRGYDTDKLERTIIALAKGEQLPSKLRDHPLKGNYAGYRECHVDGEGDWLLIYKKYEDKLILVMTATGTHSDLFE